MEEKPEVSQTCIAITKIAFDGVTIPYFWPYHITCDDGRPDSAAIWILAEIVNRYQLTEVRDEATGFTSHFEQRFNGSRLQTSYEHIADITGFSKTQVEKAIDRLIVAKLLTKEHKKTRVGIEALPDTFYLEPIEKSIRHITYTCPDWE